MAGLSLLGGLVVLPVVGPPAAAGEADTRQALRLVREVPEARLLLGLLAAESVAIGALDVVYVVLAVSLLELGGSGAGYLNAAFGAGGVLGVVATAALVGRRRLTPALAAGALAWCGAFVVLGADPRTATAFALLAVAGAGRTVMDVAGRTLLQRIAPVELLARVFGLLEGLSMLALAFGSLLTPLLVGLAGGKAAVIGVGAILPVALLLVGAAAARDRPRARPCRWSSSRCCGRCRCSRRSARRSSSRWLASSSRSRRPPARRSSAKASRETASSRSPTASWR